MIILEETAKGFLLRPEGECLISSLEEDLAAVRERWDKINAAGELELDLQKITELDTAYFQFLLVLSRQWRQKKAGFKVYPGDEFSHLLELYGIDESEGQER